ncbi:MAG: hypothetical protein AAF479_04960, partial [Pseudomonadota bacterium]
LEGKMRVSVVATGIDAESAMARPPMEAPARRKPVETDPGIVAAIRGQRREDPAPTPEVAVEPAPEVAAEATPEPAVAKAPEEEVIAEAPVTEVALEREAPEPVAERLPNPEPVVEPDPEPAPAAAAPTRDARYATAPSPSDIRARAEEVRQRALAARARKEQERNQPVGHADEPALFDLDERSFAPRPLTQPERLADAPQAQAAQEPEAQDAEIDPAPAARSGLFTINKLIHRVSGQGGTEEAQAPAAPRSEPSAPRMEEDPGDIPAFLRRQAN